MAYSVKYFKGKINGRSLYSFINKLDYSLNQQDRIKKIYEILYTQHDGEYLDLFFEKVFEQRLEKRQGKWVDASYVKLLPSSTDGLSLELNVCKALEKMADYILFSPDGERITKKTKYNFYPEEQFKRKTKEQLNLLDINNNEDEEVIDFLIRKGVNYKKSKDQCVTMNDIIKCPTLQEYYLYLSALQTQLKKLKNRYEQGDKEISYSQIIQIMQHITLTKNDMKYVKDHLFGTIYFKAVLPDSCEIDYDKFDFFNKDHIEALLQCRNQELSDDVGCLVRDLNNLIKRIKLSQTDKNILELYRSDIEMTHNKVAELLGLTRQYVTQQLSKIINRIIKEYYRVYEDWYYLNVCKGRYKQCSKCGEIKLATDTYFSPDNRNKDGFHSICKSCR